jgi:hypothetical protein
VKKTFKASDLYRHFTTNKSALPELEKVPNYDKKMLKIVEDMETKDGISKAKDAEKKRLEEIEKASLDPQKPHQKKQNLKDPITGQTTGTGYGKSFSFEEEENYQHFGISICGGEDCRSKIACALTLRLYQVNMELAFTAIFAI